MSNRIVSPTSIANRSWMPRSIDTSGSGAGPFQNAPSITRVFARKRSPRAHRFDVRQVRFTAIDADDACTQHRNQLELAGAVRRIGKERAHPLELAALHVEEKHVG
jgi:hypothetical protein